MAFGLKLPGSTVDAPARDAVAVTKLAVLADLFSEVIDTKLPKAVAPLVSMVLTTARPRLNSPDDAERLQAILVDVLSPLADPTVSVDDYRVYLQTLMIASAANTNSAA